MKIDIATHVVPEKYKKALDKVAANLEATRRYAYVTGDLRVPTLSNMDQRFAIMDRYGDMKQVLTLSLLVGTILNDPAYAVDFAKRANDEMAELVARHPDRFAAGVASVPTTDMDAALGEIERAVEKLGLKGVNLFTPVNGSRLSLDNAAPIFEKMASYDLPIWIHPGYPGPVDRSSYKNFYAEHVFGWPYESTLAMTFLALDGLFDRFPGVKVIIHHCGALVPFFDARITVSYEGSETIFGMKHKVALKRPLIDYFKMFYTDTALSGGTAGLMCGYALFGPDHLVFGTDMPYDAELGNLMLRETIASIERMTIDEQEKEAIYCGNAKKLLKLS